MMILRIGKRPAKHGFTLVELIIVMTLLAIVISVAGPQLSRFFHGRSLDTEARRMLSLVRLGQSRAVSEGLPMIVWFDAANRMYGLKAEPTFEEEDVKEIQYSLGEDLDLEVRSTTVATPAPSRLTGPLSHLPSIRIDPDGSMHASSPDEVAVKDVRGEVIWMVRSVTGLHYEITHDPNR